MDGNIDTGYEEQKSSFELSPSSSQPGSSLATINSHLSTMSQMSDQSTASSHSQRTFKHDEYNAKCSFTEPFLRIVLIKSHMDSTDEVLFFPYLSFRIQVSYFINRHVS